MKFRSLPIAFLIPVLGYQLLHYVALGTWDNSYETRMITLPYDRAYTTAKNVMKEDGWQNRTAELSKTAEEIGMLHGSGKQFLLRPADDLVIVIGQVAGKPGLSSVTMHTTSCSSSAFALRDRLYKKMEVAVPR